MADALIRVDGVSGATDLGDGRVVLILDSPALARARAPHRRLEVAPMTEPFILFTVAGTTYGLRSRDVAHIEMVDQITAVPNAAHFVDGVVFSRGQVVPALNLRARFGFERAPYDLSTRLLVVREGGAQRRAGRRRREGVRGARPGVDSAARLGADRA